MIDWLNELTLHDTNIEVHFFIFIISWFQFLWHWDNFAVLNYYCSSGIVVVVVVVAVIVVNYVNDDNSWVRNGEGEKKNCVYTMSELDLIFIHSFIFLFYVQVIFFTFAFYFVIFMYLFLSQCVCVYLTSATCGWSIITRFTFFHYLLFFSYDIFHSYISRFKIM